MKISLTARILLWSVMGFGFSFIYVPLILVVINSFNKNTSFAWPPTGFTTSWWSKAMVNEGVRDAIVAHGTGTVANDRVEAEVYEKVWGTANLRVMTPKASLGHLSMACGAVESALAVKCLQEGCVAGPEAGDRELDPECPIGNSSTRERQAPRHILKPSFGFGGQNACLLFNS